MREQAQQWIALSNREESMARVLSRNGFHDGAEWHAARAASAALLALLSERGWTAASTSCEALCHLLEAHDLTPPSEVFHAARTLDARTEDRTLSRPPATPPGQAEAAECLAALQTVRLHVNTALSKT
jgi:HEPN domain-containing protein